jgi:predicted transcriptional regulator
VARQSGKKAPNVHTTLVRLEKAGIVRSYYVKATRVFVLAEKRFKRR